MNHHAQLSPAATRTRERGNHKRLEARKMITRPFRGLLRKFGFDIVFAPQYGFPPDLDEQEITFIREAQSYTMTCPEKIFALMDGLRYISTHRIEGDIVECGVWKGGSMMIAANTLLRQGDTERTLHLFDTFGGMPEPSEKDCDYSGTSAAARLQMEAGVQACASLDGVKKAMNSTGYPPERIRYVVGRVEDTLPANAPEKIALLRLDTDWYESTRHELIHLFPRLAVGGVLIIDDYGYWDGSRRATDEYFARTGSRVFLVRAEVGRIAVKQ
jgi:O-methyltransferase